MLDRAKYDTFRVTPTDPGTLRASHVESIVKKLASTSDGRVRFEQFAESVEGRPIYLVTIGTGSRRVLLWSQMHGDEPTHTAVVLDLFNYLLQTPARPQATEILEGCTLLFIPMLNPDGAEIVSRFNAQGIDVNRDWRRLSTQEGRALKHAVESLKPQFGFNLHNQHARTSVGRPPKLAAVSVLAPAPDASGNETPAMRAAKQMCTRFVEAVRPHADGMISRYDDTYEPRAFGDGIQSTGTATMLVEAGGWPEADPEPMTRLHFHGMLATLHAIATDSYKTADIDVYESLPESNRTRLNDCLIHSAHVLDATVSAPFVADLAIDQSYSARLAVSPIRDGQIVEVGDLGTSAAKHTIEAGQSIVLPGRIAILDDWKPTSKPGSAQIQQSLSQGATSIIAKVNLADADTLHSIGEMEPLPMNWGFVGVTDALHSLTSGEVIERIAIGAAHGMLALVSDAADETLWQIADHFGLPLCRSVQLAAEQGTSYQDLVRHTWRLATLLKLHTRRARINRGYRADLLFFHCGDQSDASRPVDWKSLDRVMVAGEVVWRDGEWTGANPGTHL